MGSEGIAAIWALLWILGAIWVHSETNFPPLHPLLLLVSPIVYPTWGLLAGIEAWITDQPQGRRQRRQRDDVERAQQIAALLERTPRRNVQEEANQEVDEDVPLDTEIDSIIGDDGGNP